MNYFLSSHTIPCILLIICLPCRTHTKVTFIPEQPITEGTAQPITCNGISILYWVYLFFQSVRLQRGTSRLCAMPWPSRRDRRRGCDLLLWLCDVWLGGGWGRLDLVNLTSLESLEFGKQFHIYVDKTRPLSANQLTDTTKKKLFYAYFFAHKGSRS
jgi:hypothetical protein